MNYIVGLIGMSRHGKSTVASVFKNNNFVEYAYGDAVKKEYAELNGFPLEEMYNEHKEKHRPGIIKHGEDKRLINPYHWINEISDEITNDFKSKKNVIISDMRRIPEVDFFFGLKKKYGNKKVFLFEIIRPPVNGGVFDEDAETSKALQYANYHNYIDIKVLNVSDEKTLIETIQ